MQLQTIFDIWLYGIMFGVFIYLVFLAVMSLILLSLHYDEELKGGYGHRWASLALFAASILSVLAGIFTLIMAVGWFTEFMAVLTS